jgi:hypothetical protein
MEKGKFYFSVKDFLEDNVNNTKNIFILVAEYTSFNLEDLKDYNGEIFGGIVPFVVYNNEYYDKGIIVCSLGENSDFLLVEDLNHLDVNHTFFENRKSKIMKKKRTYPASIFTHLFHSSQPASKQLRHS